MKQKVTNIKKNVPEEQTLEIKTERLLNPGFIDAIRKLIKIPMKNNQGMKIKRGVLLIEAAVNSYHKERVKVLEKYCEKNEAGEMLFEDPDKKLHKILLDKEGDFDSEMGELLGKTIKFPTVHASAILGVDVTPEFLVILDGLVLED